PIRFWVACKWIKALACLLVGTLWATDDPFCRKWKLNVERNKFPGEQVRIQDLGGNKFKWTANNHDCVRWHRAGCPFRADHIDGFRGSTQLENSDQEGRQGSQLDDSQDL